MSSAMDTVKRFLDAWETPLGYRAAVQEFFTKDCVYENVGLSNTTGTAESIAFLDQFEQQMGFAILRIDMHAIAASGDTVLTERTDHLCDRNGKLIASLRVMGVFEIAGGRIAAWRDYFDPTPLKGG